MSERVPFGYKTAWLAIGTTAGERVVEALGLRAVRRVGWEGVEESYEAGVWVSPPLGPWTLSVGVALGMYEPDVAHLSSMLDAEVQWFGSNRVVEAHGWSKAMHGEIERAFFYVGDQGELVRNDGVPTPVEVEEGILGPGEWEPGPFPPPDLWRDDWAVWPDELLVMRVAAGWSVDPSALAGTDDRVGWLGEYP